MAPRTPDNLTPRPTCHAHSKTTGKLCGRPAVPGGKVCRWHGGAAPQVARKAAMVRTIEQIRENGGKVNDPAAQMLEIMTASDTMWRLYSSLLDKTWQAAQTGADPQTPIELDDDQYMAVAAGLAGMGVRAFVTPTRAAGKAPGEVIITGEQVSALADLEMKARDVAMQHARIAFAAGLADRELKLAERLVDRVLGAVNAALDAAETTPEAHAAGRLAAADYLQTA